MIINKGDPIYFDQRTAGMFKRPGLFRYWLGWSNRDGIFEGEALCLKYVTRTKSSPKEDSKKMENLKKGELIYVKDK